MWAGEGLSGLPKWYALSEDERSLWWEHFMNTHTGAYDAKRGVVDAHFSMLDAEQQAIEAMNRRSAHA